MDIALPPVYFRVVPGGKDRYFNVGEARLIPVKVA